MLYFITNAVKTEHLRETQIWEISDAFLRLYTCNINIITSSASNFTFFIH